MSTVASPLAADLVAFMQDGGDGERFDALARAVFAHQVETLPLVRRLAERAGRSPDDVESWEEIPAMPVAAFKQAELFSGDPASAAHVFSSSGTSGASPSRSFFSNEGLALMEASIDANAAAMLFPDGAKTRIFVLAPAPEIAPQMIMAWGMARLIDRYGLPGSRFVIGREGLDKKGLVADLKAAAADDVPVTIIGASFGFVHLLDGLREAGIRIPCAPGSRTMDAGGYKGRSRELSRAELDAALAETFAVPDHHNVNLLGMTELASQFYDGVLRDGSAEPRRKTNAPWTRTRVVHPATLDPVAPGEEGILVHVDLANLERPAFIRTDDWGRVDEAGWQVLGRAEGADARGCSLSVEELLG